MYGYKCEYCDGVVQERMVEQEVFKHRDGFVILENVPIGVCNKCGSRYYHSTLLHWVEEIATRKKSPKRMELVPVATFERRLQLAAAAEALLPDYAAGGELTIFTALDSEDFYASG